MLAWLMKHLERLADSVIDPILNWILKLRWIFRLLILLVIAILIGAVYYHNRVSGWVLTSTKAIRVWRGQGDRIPLRGGESESLNSGINDLSLYLDDEFAKRTGDNPIYGSWTIANIVVALGGRSRVLSADNVSQFMASQIAPSGNCWRQLRNLPCHFANSAWVLMSFASVGARPSEQQIKFILDGQKADGWWSIFETSNDPENASTYATAISVLALYEVTRKNLVDPQMIGPIQNAINRGRAWLLKTQVPGKARWITYPLSNIHDAKESVALSGLVIHLLYHLTPAPESNVAKLWLRSLPTNIPKTNEPESTGHTIRITPQDWLADEFKHYPLPWLIIGTVDAYKFGDLKDKAAALTWIDRFMDNIHESKRQSYDFPWITAEFEISLRYLNGEDVI